MKRSDGILEDSFKAGIDQEGISTFPDGADQEFPHNASNLNIAYHTWKFLHRSVLQNILGYYVLIRGIHYSSERHGQTKGSKRKEREGEGGELSE